MKLLLLFSAICVSLNSFSQKGDYLIKNNGDTIWGDITLKNKVFYVKGASVAGIRAEDIVKIKSENFKGSTVLRCNLQLYTDNLTDLEIGYMPRNSTDTVLILAEIYSTPKINLYYGTSNFRTQFYFYKTPADPKPIQLIVHYYLDGGLDNYYKDRGKYRGDRSRITIIEDRSYVNQLRGVMGGCKEITETMWELLSYRDYSFKQVIKKYNRCNQ
ncbi:MAG: hypothetical protein ABIR78_08785 [Ferruginibacter sp.]